MLVFILFIYFLKNGKKSLCDGMGFYGIFHKVYMIRYYNTEFYSYFFELKKVLVKVNRQ